MGDRTDALNSHADLKVKGDAGTLVKEIRTALANQRAGLKNAGSSARTSAKLRNLRAPELHKATKRNH